MIVAPHLAITAADLLNNRVLPFYEEHGIHAERRRVVHSRLLVHLDVGADTGTPVDDKDYQVPCKFTGTLTKLTLTIDRPQLTPEDEKQLREAQRNNKTSE